jgi:phosphoribosyl-ATP pyrophosphohydrolase
MAKKITKKIVKKVSESKGAKPKAASLRKAAPKAVFIAPPPPGGPNALILDRLWSTILTRKTADPLVSHSARLLARGTAKVAQKFGEEAVECLIEAVAGNRGALIGESADVLYHLLVLWVDAGLRPEDVWQELSRREGISGIVEKAARPGLTRKIP